MTKLYSRILLPNRHWVVFSIILFCLDSVLTQQKSQGASQAMLYATGLKEEDMAKPQVGICSMWYEGNPCNMHLLELSESVKEGVVASGLVGYRFNTIGVSDGISMGTSGMRFSLQSRDLIADSIETTMGAQWYDGLIALPGCDKNMPGCIMAMGRLNRPGIMVYGGTIRAGKQPSNGASLDVVSAFQAYGQYVYDKISEEERKEILQHACPGAGACGGMYTANTMATAIEALGMSLPYSSSSPADSKEKINECLAAGEAMKLLLEKDIKPRDIMTKGAFENAIRIVMMTGGSTNAVLHLIAMSRSCQDPNVALTLDDFQRISNVVSTTDRGEGHNGGLDCSRMASVSNDSFFGGDVLAVACLILFSTPDPLPCRSETFREICHGGRSKHWWHTWVDQIPY
jgi:dihydroxy-acid dehydratase